MRGATRAPSPEGDSCIGFSWARHSCAAKNAVAAEAQERNRRRSSWIAWLVIVFPCLSGWSQEGVGFLHVLLAFHLFTPGEDPSTSRIRRCPVKCVGRCGVLR